MTDRIAFVVDTNFIIENSNLEEVCHKITDNNGVLYVTQVAIEERIAQECIKQRDLYNELEKIKKKTHDIAEIKITKEYEKTEATYRAGMQKRYDDLLQGTIIPLCINEDTFRRILKRAYMKTPPFINGKTDKGFKDSLMWISVLEYFKSNGEEVVIFISNDNGFKENKEFLKEEFEKETRKKIEIKENKYYKERFVEAEVQEKESVPEELPNVERYRDRIRTIMDEIRIEAVEMWWGQDYVQTFTTSKPFDEEYLEQVFAELNEKIRKHIFEISVSAKEIFDIDDRITDGDVPVRISSLEKAYALYTDIAKAHPECLTQFYSASSKILNLNYVAEEKWNTIPDEDIPF